jgi:hypothetical protein
MKKLMFLLFCPAIAFNSFGQSDISGPGIGHQRTPGRFCGWAPGTGSTAGPFELRNDFLNQPINFFTTTTGVPTQRMTITPTGLVGIGNTNPLSPLHVYGSGTLEPGGSGWNRAITISDGALAFTYPNGANPTFFMAYPSDSPGGNLFAGSSSQLSGGGTIDYAYQIGSSSSLGGNVQNPLNSVQFFKNVLLYPAINPGTITTGNQRFLGINTFVPQNIVHINTAATSPVPGNSGLRFEDLTSGSTLQPNPGDGVLTAA